MPAFIFFRQEIKIFSKTFLFIFIFIWSIQQFIYTGCFFFPLIVSCLDMSWFNLDPLLDLLNHTKGINKSFAQYQGNLSELEYSKNFNWVLTWFNRNKIEMLEHLLTFVIIFFLLILIFFRKNITRYNKNSSYKYNIFYLSFFIIFLQVLFWFNTSPVVRFGFHYVLLFLFFLLSLIFNKFLLRIFVYKHVIFLIYIGLILNIQKNLFRIYEDIKINNTIFYTYPKIFFKNENIADKKININYLIKDKSIYCWDTPSICLAGNQNLIIDRVNGYLVIVRK